MFCFGFLSTYPMYYVHICTQVYNTYIVYVHVQCTGPRIIYHIISLSSFFPCTWSWSWSLVVVIISNLHPRNNKCCLYVCMYLRKLRFYIALRLANKYIGLLLRFRNESKAININPTSNLQSAYPQNSSANNKQYSLIFQY
jgi:hypothetical protein